ADCLGFFLKTPPGQLGKLLVFDCFECEIFAQKHLLDFVNRAHASMPQKRYDSIAPSHYGSRREFLTAGRERINVPYDSSSSMSLKIGPSFLTFCPAGITSKNPSSCLASPIVPT